MLLDNMPTSHSFVVFLFSLLVKHLYCYKFSSDFNLTFQIVFKNLKRKKKENGKENGKKEVGSNELFPFKLTTVNKKKKLLQLCKYMWKKSYLNHYTL